MNSSAKGSTFGFEGKPPEFITLTGTGTGQVIMPAEDWVDLSQAVAWERFGQILGITNCSFLTETSVGPEGPWMEAHTPVTQVFCHIDVVSSLDPGQARGGFLRWRVDGGTGAWQICFRVGLRPIDLTYSTVPVQSRGSSVPSARQSVGLSQGVNTKVQQMTSSSIPRTTNPSSSRTSSRSGDPFGQKRQ